MRDKLNCPNCGHPIDDVICSYCGTVFYDFANIELNGSSYIRLKVFDTLQVFKVRLNTIRTNYDACSLPTIEMDFVILPDDQGVLIKRMADEGDGENG